MSLRTSVTRAVFSSWPGGTLKTQIELLFLQRYQLVLKLIGGHRLQIAHSLLGLHGNLHQSAMRCTDTRADRKLCTAETQGLACDFLVHTVDLEHDPTRLDTSRPVFRRTLALTHADFGRLL